MISIGVNPKKKSLAVEPRISIHAHSSTNVNETDWTFQHTHCPAMLITLHSFPKAVEDLCFEDAGSVSALTAPPYQDMHGNAHH